MCLCGDDTICAAGVEPAAAPSPSYAIEFLVLQRSFALGTAPAGGVHSGHASPVPLARSLAFHGSHSTVPPGGAPSTRSETHLIQQFAARVPITSRFLATASVPYVIRRVEEPGSQQSTRGIGDPEAGLECRVASFVDFGGEIALAAGARFPLGETDARDASGAPLPAHDQLGLGSFGGSLGVVSRLSRGGTAYLASTSVSVNGTSDDRFHAGNAWRGNLAVLRALGNRWEGRCELNARHALADRVEERLDPDSGGFVLVVSPGVRTRFGGGISLSTQVQVPVVEALRGNQDEGVNFISAVGWTRGAR